MRWALWSWMSQSERDMILKKLCMNEGFCRKIDRECVSNSRDKLGASVDVGTYKCGLLRSI